MMRATLARWIRKAADELRDAAPILVIIVLSALVTGCATHLKVSDCNQVDLEITTCHCGPPEHPIETEET